MNIVESYEKAQDLINKNGIVLMYFRDKNCGVCNIIKPKLEETLNKYPKVNSLEINVGISPKLAATFNIFTIPAILVFIERKETIREARYINILDIDSKLSRYYQMLFD